MLSVNGSSPEPTAPVRSSLQNGCSYETRGTDHRSTSPGQSQPRALLMPEASLDFFRGGIPKNKTQGLTQTRKSLLEDDAEPESLNSLGFWSSMNQGHPNHLCYDLNSTEGAGKESSLLGLKMSGVFCEAGGTSACNMRVSRKKSGFRSNPSPRLISSFGGGENEMHSAFT